MSRSEPVHTSRRLRLSGRQRPGDLDSNTLDELVACLENETENGTSRVDAIELAFDHSSTTAAIDALEQLEEADYEIEVRELVVEVSR